MKEIGSKLKTLRKGMGLTQQALSERLDISRTTISNYEIGRRTPHLEELKRIARFFGVGLDYFDINTSDEIFEFLCRAERIFLNPDISKEDRDNVYKSIMKMYLQQ